MFSLMTNQIARTKGLGSELISFQCKLLHKLLSTQERIARLGLNEDQPRLCLHSRLETENLVHFFFDRIKKMQVGRLTWHCLAVSQIFLLKLLCYWILAAVYLKKKTWLPSASSPLALSTIYGRPYLPRRWSLCTG